MGKTLIISVGGTPEPVIYSINKLCPDYIIFFVSRESEYLLNEIREKIAYKYKADEKIVLMDPEDLSEAYAILQEKLPPILNRWKVRTSSLLVDYTCGTKSMSSALVLATIQDCKRFIYVGGEERTKGGKGTVIAGKEKLLSITNPWNKYAVVLKKNASILFNKCLFDPAVELLEKAKNMVDKIEQGYFQMWIDFINGYKFWDRFKHKEALHLLYKAKAKMESYLLGKSSLKKIYKHLERDCKFLTDLNDEKLLLDLIANARRRAEVEGKFDDAVARLYRALEKIAQNELKKLGINPSNVREEQIPETIREEFIKKYKVKDKNGKERIKLSLYADYQLLKELGNPKGIKFFKNHSEIENVLNVRNNSILAHGDVPVKPELYRGFLEELLRFAGITERQLPSFPLLEIP